MTPEINLVLQAIQEHLSTTHASGQPGTGHADNVSDATDAIDKFLANVADRLVREVGLSHKAAAEIVFRLAYSAADEQHLPPLPQDSADPEELAIWLGKAGTWGFSAKALKLAKGAHDSRE